MGYSVPPVGVIFDRRRLDRTDFVSKRFDRWTLQDARDFPFLAPLLNPADEPDGTNHPLVLSYCSPSLEGFKVFAYNSINTRPGQ